MREFTCYRPLYLILRDERLLIDTEREKGTAQVDIMSDFRAALGLAAWVRFLNMLARGKVIMLWQNQQCEFVSI